MLVESGAFRSLLALCVLTLPVVGLPRNIEFSPSQPGAQITGGKHSLLRLPAARGFVTRRLDQKIICSAASPDEARSLRRDDRIAPLHVISNVRRGLSAEAAGLTIVLRATDQLESFPQAKAAYLAAAATWESLIATPITITIDVDFGPTWFGEAFGASVLGETTSQEIGDDSIYPDLRQSLIENASTAQETTLYDALPVASVPTDLGPTTLVIAPSATWRALGFISATADPVGEESDFGDPPATGFNSSFSYDFNPDDGISPGRLDFNAIALHELGHVLGFDSEAGARELDADFPLAVSIWDLFRLRPGSTLDAFPTVQRIISSGGQQVHFTGSSELGLSTGRPDGSGGDGNQASHWQDDRITGHLIGVMDPTLEDGQHVTITSDDLLALDSFGYRLRTEPANPNAPALSQVSLTGKKITINGSRLIAPLQVEINGLVVSPPINATPNSSGTKLKLKGSRSALNLTAGPNQVRVISAGLGSNTLMLNL
jgi:hypothetical protein